MNFLINGADKLKSRPGFKLIGRDNDLARFSSILMRTKANSVLLSGPGGVGCSALCLGLQAMKNDPDAPFDIVNKRLFWLDTDALFSSGNSEEINANFQKVYAILKRTPDSILIIEDTKDFIEASRNYGTTHFMNSLNSMIKMDYTQVVLETRDEDLDVVLKTHTDISEYYTMLDLNEPTFDVLPDIIRDSSNHLIEHHGIKIDDVAMKTAIEVTSKYRSKDMGLSRAQPERTLTLLDRALSTYRLNAHKHHPKLPGLIAAGAVQTEIDALNQEFAATQAEIRKLFKFQRDGENAIIELEERREALIKKEAEAKSTPETAEIAKFGSIAMSGGFASPEMKEVNSKIKQFQGMIDENRVKFDELTASINDQLILGHNDVVSEFSRISGISVDKMNEDELEKLKHLEADMLKLVYGQNNAVKRLAQAVKVAKIGRRNKEKPMASFMYIGPSGVGKTFLAKVLAGAIFDDPKALLRFDMSEYMEKHAVAKLIGAPPGYEGFEAGGILTNAIRRNPNQIILFDEIEKANKDVFNVMLQILDDGRLTDNVGRTVDFNNTIIIMTSNIGQPHFLNEELNWEEQQKLAIAELDQTYRPEFLNRFAGRQNIICFQKLKLSDMEKIIKREIDDLDASYVSQGINVRIEEDALHNFCSDYYDPRVGARGLPGIIQTTLEPIITDSILENSGFVGTFEIGYDTEEKKFTHKLVEKPNAE